MDPIPHILAGLIFTYALMGAAFAFSSLVAARHVLRRDPLPLRLLLMAAIFAALLVGWPLLFWRGK